MCRSSRRSRPPSIATYKERTLRAHLQRTRAVCRCRAADHRNAGQPCRAAVVQAGQGDRRGGQPVRRVLPGARRLHQGERAQRQRRRHAELPAHRRLDRRSGAAPERAVAVFVDRHRRRRARQDLARRSAPPAAGGRARSAGVGHARAAPHAARTGAGGSGVHRAARAVGRHRADPRRERAADRPGDAASAATNACAAAPTRTTACRGSCAKARSSRTSPCRRPAITAPIRCA